MFSIPGTSMLGVKKDTSGLWVIVEAPTSGMTLDTTADIYAAGCICINKGSSVVYKNIGTSAAPAWFALGPSTGSVTTTADGTGTGAIPTGVNFVTVTSAAAGNQAGLPAISSSTVGQTIDLFVGANGYELITPASSNNTINTVDSDGTNQLDVAANTLLRCTQVSSTGWVCFQVAATTITVVAPDND